MALLKPTIGNRTNLDNISLNKGYAYFCTDDSTCHIDYVDAYGNLHRKQISKDFIKQLLNITDDTSYLDGGTIIQEEVNTNG